MFIFYFLFIKSVLHFNLEYRLKYPTPLLVKDNENSPNIYKTIIRIHETLFQYINLLDLFTDEEKNLFKLNGNHKMDMERILDQFDEGLKSFKIYGGRPQDGFDINKECSIQ